MEHVVEDVRVLVGSDPAQGMELEFTMGHIGVERGEFKSADIELNANFSQLLLQHRGQQASALLGRCLHREMETYAVDRRMSRRIEQLPCTSRVVGIVANP